MSKNSNKHLSHLLIRTTRTRNSTTISRALRAQLPKIVEEIQNLALSQRLIQSHNVNRLLLRSLSQEFKILPDEELVNRLRNNDYFQLIVLRAIAHNDDLLNQITALLSADASLYTDREKSIKSEAFSRFESLSNYDGARSSGLSGWQAPDVIKDNSVIPQASDKALSINQHAARFLKDLVSHNKLVAREYTDEEYRNAPMDNRLTVDIRSVEQAVKETRALIEQSIQKAPS